VTYATIGNDIGIDIVSGDYDTQRASLVFNMTGQYGGNDWQYRPKVSLNYTHYDNDAYQLTGSLEGIPLSFEVASDSFDNASVEGTFEVSRFIETARSVVIPYAEFGARYSFIRPNDGDILTAELVQASTSAWVGSLRLGARALVSRATFVESSIGYLSVGQDGTDAWELRLFLSRAF